MNQKEFGLIISNSRKLKKLTQEQFAEMLGVSSKSVSRWENGVNMPDISLLPKISEILEVSLFELLGGSNEVKKENVEVVLKNTINKVSKTDRLLRILKIIIIVLLIILITVSILFFVKVYGNNKYLFNVLPEKVKVEKIGLNYNLAAPLNYDDNYTKISHSNRIIGLEEGIYSKLPLYNYKNSSLIIPNENDILYSIGTILDGEEFGYSEEDCNKTYKDKYYTKKSMYVISVILFNNIYNLETVTFHFTNQNYQINKNDLKELFDFRKATGICNNGECIDGDILYISNYDNQVKNKLKDNEFLDEFIADKKIKSN